MESPSPSRALQASARRQSLAVVAAARSSAFSPIDVDGDSADDADPPATRHQDLAALSSHYNQPSVLDLSANITSNSNNIGTKRRQQRAMELQYKRTDDSEKKQSEHKDDAASPSSSLDNSSEGQEESKSNLTFFFKMATSTKPQRDSLTRRSSSAQSSSPQDELHEVISAARTSICGQSFDRCELEFGDDRVELTIWKDNKARWQGEIKYAHMVRFCFSRVNHPPYILLLQLDSSRGRSDFATFYDPIYAKEYEETMAKEQATTKVYGVVFYFDEEMDYMRCHSMGDNNPKLAHLFREELSESEVQQYLRLDASSKLRHPRRIESKSSTSGTGGGSLVSMMGNGARHALGTMTSFFHPKKEKPRSSALREDDNPLVVRDQGSSTRGRTLNLSLKSNGSPPADFDEKKAPISIDDAGTDKRDRWSGADNGVETVVLTQSTQQDELDKRDMSVGDAASSLLQQEEKAREKVESRKRAAASRREDEKMKRRRIASRRNELLLTYPYDGSDTSGRISVTLGDVDRLVPGEFLNDNIIDFYLRFLWRHLNSWQQQQMYFFTSHFFTQLNGTNGAHELTTSDPDERFARVARWTQRETNFFDKRFIFIPINDSFHWSIAVFCNPGSAIIKKHRKVRRRRRITTATCSPDKREEVVDLVDGDDGNAENEGTSEAMGSDGEQKIEEEELQSCQEDRIANPPCLLFLDSLRCHRKKKFTKMLRNYLECEWKARYASSAAASVSKQKSEVGAGELDVEESIVTTFDLESIDLVEPNIPMQSNSSDCGVFLLMYAASIVRLFPAGVVREDLESNLMPTLTPTMFRDEHVLEFREYLQQLLFCLQFLEKSGLSEEKVKDEGLELFTID